MFNLDWRAVGVRTCKAVYVGGSKARGRRFEGGHRQGERQRDRRPDGGSTPRELLKKLRKSYACEVPVDLLCYADLVTADDVALEEMRAVVDAEGLGPFRSIWFHGEDGVYLVAPRRGSK